MILNMLTIRGSSLYELPLIKVCSYKNDNKLAYSQDISDNSNL